MTILELLIQNGHAPGAYFNVCHECKAEFIGDKRAITCLECASKRVGNVAEPNAQSVLSEVRALLDMLNREDVIIMQSTALRQGEFEELLRKVSEHFR